MPPDADLTARLRALAAAKPETIVKLRRVRQFGGVEHGKTLMFTFEGGTNRSQRSRSSFVNVEHVPPFEGEEAWFVVEEVRAKPWGYWRAVRQVEAPNEAKARDA